MARRALAGVAVLLFLVGVPTVAGIAPAVSLGAVSFTTPVFVDTVRAGGEPLVIHSTKAGDLVYSSHEGTTHLDRSGLPSSSTVGFFCPGALEPTVPQPCYENHVWVWTSTDLGKTWTFRDEGVQYTGFSDPDLTEDAGGAIYDTGIDLANDAVFSSQDGGVTWPHGTAQCHEGDRPWLAGGKAGEVFMTTDADQTNGSTVHTLFYSNNYADSCSSNGIADIGPWQGSGNFSGFGKGVYDPVDGSFIEPAQFNNADGTVGVGYSRLPNAAAAFSSGGTFQPVEVDKNTSIFSPFGAPNVMTMDKQENLYFAWDTNERSPNTTNGCGFLPPVSCGTRCDSGRRCSNALHLRPSRRKKRENSLKSHFRSPAANTY